MKHIHIKLGILFIFINLSSCASNIDYNNNRVLLAKSEKDQSSIFDSNGDKLPDIERWYRGSGITFEKIDSNFDGYWDFQGERYPSGKFEIYIKYPEKRYSVKTNHTFYASKAYAFEKVILAREE